jgi:hypothetical protein
MSITESIKLIVYRYAEKGVEVLMNETDCQNLVLPNISSNADLLHQNEVSDSDTIQIGDENCFAMEADFPHVDLSNPTTLDKFSGMLDNVLSRNSKSKYVALKEIFKSVLPNEYALLKEFKDIISDRNSIRNL